MKGPRIIPLDFICILLLFNANDTLKLGQIRIHTQIPDTQLRWHHFVPPKTEFFEKGPKCRSILSDSDMFISNNHYTTKMRRVQIHLVKEASIAPPASSTQQHPDGNASTKYRRC